MFLLEITPQDYWYLLYGAVAGILCLIIFLGSLAVAFDNIRNKLWNPLSGWLFAASRERNKRLDDLSANVLTCNENLNNYNSTLEEIKKEVKTNGGSSLKDAVCRIEQEVKGISKNADYTSAKLHHLDMVAEEAIFEMDVDDGGHLNCIQVNPALCELLNTTESEMLGRNWLTKIYGGDAERVGKEWKNAVENCCPVDSVHYFKLSTRKSIQIRVLATPRMNREGNLRGFFGRMVKAD